MSAIVKQLLQKINFIEADMNLHRQILVSIPSQDRDQMETVIKKIADQKKQIEGLRQRIKKEDEEEYNKLIAIEQATKKFQELSADKKFVVVNTLNDTGECYITLNDGTRIDCLVAAKQEDGHWTILTIDGQVREYPAGLVN
jgi:vacuolar-type H+-ATPase subunit I/STV1